MALESGTYIKDLVDTNPPGTDAISQGDDHIRLIKTVLQNSFPSTNNAPIIPDITGNGLKYLQVNSGATATQWANIRQRGYVSKARFEWSSATQILIGAGEYEVDDGTAPENYYWDSQLTFTIGSGGSNSASSAAGTSQWQYLYIDDSAISASPLVAGSFLNSTTAPTYNHTKHGWYNGSDRCIFAFYIDASGNIAEFYHDGNEAVGYGTPFSTNINSSSSWKRATLTMPAFATKALTTFYSDGNGTGISKFFYRTYGSTSTWGHLVGKVEDDEAEWNVSGFQVFTDSSGRIEVIDQVATSNYNVEVHSTGYFLPNGM